MASVDLHNQVNIVNAFDTVDIASPDTVVGNIIDMNGYESLELIIQGGVIAGAGSYVPEIYDGDDAALADAALVADQFLLGTEAAASLAPADSHVVRRIGYVGKKRYVRVTVVATGAGTGVVSIVGVQSAPLNAPVANN
jgi:hypothetical protein